jgi:hypothetical protein
MAYRTAVRLVSALLLTVLIALPASRLAAAEVCGQPTKCKDVGYLGYTVIFSIPAHWITIVEDGVPYYSEDSEDPAVLTLFVQDDPCSGPHWSEATKAHLRTQGQVKDAEIETLPGDRAIKTMTEHHMLDGRNVPVRAWYVASPLPPDKCRTVVFMYIMPIFGEPPPQIDKAIALLDDSVRRARVSKDSQP